MNETKKTLIAFIDTVNDQLNQFYDTITELTRGINSADNDNAKRAYLDWAVAHLHTDMVNTHTTLKNMQAQLRK